VRKTRRLATRSFRAKSGEFLAEGPQAVREALQSGAAIEVFATPKYSHWRGGTVVWNEVADDVVAEIADAVTPQGIIARCRSVVTTLPQVLAGPVRLVALCEEMRDPGNAGALIRVADAAGADAVVLAGDSVDPESPKAVRASAGSLFHLPVAQAADITTAVVALRRAGLRVLAADGNADVTIEQADLSLPTAWIFGNEAHGIGDVARGLADEVVAVPIYGRAESLNLATAAAVCLYASAAALHSNP
jgi:TrmH family RNA methyltransferase